jgi:hypothetical protein
MSARTSEQDPRIKIEKIKISGETGEVKHISPYP